VNYTLERCKNTKLWSKYEGKIHFGDLGVDGRIILKISYKEEENTDLP
jgi:hypothetical protein